MKDYPIIFSSPMVKAILGGSKTQTRRLITSRCSGPCGSAFKKDLDWSEIYPNNPLGIKVGYKKGDPLMEKTVHRVYTPYEIGDLLWVRETWTWEGDTKYTDISPIGDFWYKADFEDGEGPIRWKPSIHMPREASRITLEVLDIRAERLHEITEEDAKAEGLEYDPFHWVMTDGLWPYRAAFMELWDSINSRRGPWSADPWGWKIVFKKL